MRNMYVALLLVGGMVSAAYGAPFTQGNLVIYRVGDGTAALSSAGTAVFVDEYTTGGTLVQSIALPTAVVGSNRRLVSSGTATSEGMLTRSSDGQYLVLTGYDADVGTASIASTAAATTNRVVGRIDSSGTIDTTTALSAPFNADNIRGAASTNGTDIWVTGVGSSGTGGVWYTTFGSTTATQISTTVTNLRGVNLADGQLYVSSASGSTRIATVGSGAPTTSGQTIVNLPGTPTTGSPYGFAFADLSAGVAGVDTLYVVDDGTDLIQKFSFDGSTWSATGSVGALNVRGLTLAESGGVVTLFATSNTTLFSFVDNTGYNGLLSGSVTTLATAAANTGFRGVAFAPFSATPIPEPATVALLGLAVIGGLMLRRRVAA